MGQSGGRDESPDEWDAWEPLPVRSRKPMGRTDRSTSERYEELRQAAQEAVDARNMAIRGYDFGEPDLPILAMVRLERVLKRHAGKRIAFENPRGMPGGFDIR